MVNEKDFVMYRTIALKSGAPGFPSFSEVKAGADQAYDYLDDIYMAYLDIMEQGEPDGPFEEGERNMEYAEGTIPYQNYKAAMAFSQLALYDYEPDVIGFQPSEDILDHMRLYMLDFSLNALLFLQESDFIRSG